MIEIATPLPAAGASELRRRTRLVSGPQGPHVVIDGKPMLLLCSDNYLGLADHPRVRQAAGEAAMRWGVGACASRVVSGTMTIHRRLEERLAAFAGRESALLFGSGFLANAGVIAALARPGDVVFCDALSSASIVDGCRLSGADVLIYDHLDVEHLRWGIEQAEGRGVLIATESVFGSDGDRAPLAEIVELAAAHRLRVLVDEAHATGTTGPGGRGALAETGLEEHVDVVVGSLGKALGSYGAYVACDWEMRRFLMTAARTFVFSSAPAPPAVAGALAALDLVEQRPRLVEKLRASARALREELRDQGFDVVADGPHIVTLPIGDPQLTERICERALAQGALAQALLPPLVEAPASRLRLTAIATHRAAELRAAARMLGALVRAAGVDPARAALPAPPPPPPRETDEWPAVAGAPAGVFDYEARAA